MVHRLMSSRPRDSISIKTNVGNNPLKNCAEYDGSGIAYPEFWVSESLTHHPSNNKSPMQMKNLSHLFQNGE